MFVVFELVHLKFHLSLLRIVALEKYSRQNDFGFKLPKKETVRQRKFIKIILTIFATNHSNFDTQIHRCPDHSKNCVLHSEQVYTSSGNQKQSNFLERRIR